MKSYVMPMAAAEPPAVEINALEEFSRHMNDWIDRLSARVDEVLRRNRVSYGEETEESLPGDRKAA